MRIRRCLPGPCSQPVIPVTDVASTVAAIAAAMVVVVASYGTATGPAIAGLSAYLGGTSASTVVMAAAAAGAYKVTVSELIGQEHNSVQDEGVKQLALGGVDGALTALTAGIAKSLQLSFYAAIGIGGDAAALTSELSVGVIRGTEWSLGLMKREALIHATRGTIDGIISGAIGNVVLTAADEATWRQGVWDTLRTFGVALLQGAALGGVTGGVISGGMGAGLSKMAHKNATQIFDSLTHAGLGLDDLNRLEVYQLTILGNIDAAVTSGNAAKAKELFDQLKGHLDPEVATRFEAKLLDEDRIARHTKVSKEYQGIRFMGSLLMISMGIGRSISPSPPPPPPTRAPPSPFLPVGGGIGVFMQFGKRPTLALKGSKSTFLTWWEGI